jgi:hypothetical protein
VNPTTSQNSTEHTRRSATGSPPRPATPAPAPALAAAGPGAISDNTDPQP